MTTLTRQPPLRERTEIAILTAATRPCSEPERWCTHRRRPPTGAAYHSQTAHAPRDSRRARARPPGPARPHSRVKPSTPHRAPRRSAAGDLSRRCPASSTIGTSRWATQVAISGLAGSRRPNAQRADGSESANRRSGQGPRRREARSSPRVPLKTAVAARPRRLDQSSPRGRLTGAGPKSRRLRPTLSGRKAHDECWGAP